MKIIKNILVLCALLISLPALSWEKLENGISLDKSVHEFGDVQLGSGPLSCRFTFRNDSGKSLLIERVTSSCGCTDVKWTNTVIKSGETGEVSVVYKNDEGPWPFEKSLTVYLSSQSRPLYLKIRGVCHSKPVQLKEVYTESLGGSLAVKSLEIKGGNLEQGGQRCDCFLVANLSDKAIKLSFTDLPKQVQIMGLPITIPAKKTARVDFCVKADSQLWGKNWYSITPVINGAKGKKALKIWSITQMNTSKLSKEEKRAGSRVAFKSATYSFGKIKAGTKIQAEFTFSNVGKEDFLIHKIDLEEGTVCENIAPVKPGGSGVIRAQIDTQNLPKGEALIMIRLITNSPLRPMIDLFATGWIE